jgi:hypothetical protein
MTPESLPVHKAFPCGAACPTKTPVRLASGDHSDYSKQRPKAMLSFESRRSIPRSRGFGGKNFTMKEPKYPGKTIKGFPLCIFVTFVVECFFPAGSGIKNPRRKCDGDPVWHFED